MGGDRYMKTPGQLLLLAIVLVDFGAREHG